jgi:hypothetical protein
LELFWAKVEWLNRTNSGSIAFGFWSTAVIENRFEYYMAFVKIRRLVCYVPLIAPDTIVLDKRLIQWHFIYI